MMGFNAAPTPAKAGVLGRGVRLTPLDPVLPPPELPLPPLYQVFPEPETGLPPPKPLLPEPEVAI